MSSITYGPTIEERLHSSVTRIKDGIARALEQVRVALPGVVQSFDSTKQTVTVQLALTEHVKNLGVWQDIPIPVLPDVPIVIPRAGGFCVTLPVQQGDECLVVFADMCIDGWFQSGADSGPVQEMEERRHDLSDGFAILGCWSQPHKLSSYSTSSVQVRTDDGQTYLDLSPNQIILNANTIKLEGDVEISGALKGDEGATFTQDVSAGTPGTAISLMHHIHTVGSGTSGPPVAGT